MTRRILVDLQCAQNSSSERGIGRYATSIAAAMLAREEAHGTEIHLLLNGAFADTVPGLQRRFADAQALGRIHVFPGLRDAHRRAPGGRWREEVSTAIRVAVIQGLAPDVVFCPSLFEGEGDDLVLSPPGATGRTEIGTLHDLIPLLHPADYLDPHPAFAEYYHSRLMRLPDYDRLIAISASARKEALAHTQIAPDRIQVVLEDAAPQFRPLKPTISQMDELRRRFELDRPYILYTGATDPRKNVLRLVAAYAALPPRVRSVFDLVIAGKPDEYEWQQIDEAAAQHGVSPGRVRKLGFVPDADLPLLYGLARLFVMPSLHEGFGLPALEAIRCGTPVIGANRTSLPEVIVPEAALFDPLDIEQMANRMQRVLSDHDFASGLMKAQNAHAAGFSWERAASEALDLLIDAAGVPQQCDPTTPMRIEDDLIAVIRAVPGMPTANDLDCAARAVDGVTGLLRRVTRPRNLPDRPAWRLEGPFDSSYSLALVNRETALALDRAGAEVTLVSAEGDGPFNPDPEIFAQMPDLAPLHARSVPEREVLVTSRNLFPPRVHDISSPYALLHGYAWEETGVPLDYLRDFGTYLDGILVTSNHVRKVFVDQGIDLPLYVVGNGVDHLDRVDLLPLPDRLWPEGTTFRLLHVSSAFPRKGPDALLEGYARAFAGARDVALVIKSHPNPHNDLAEQIAQLQAAHPELPAIRLIEDNLTPGQMRSLYAEADCLVVPSRAEGFCLPIAEAVLNGTPVVATGWSGQMAFEGNSLVRFCDYVFAPADSHLGAWDSVWAEPDPDDLAAKLREVRDAGSPDADTVQMAADSLRTQFSWSRVAQRSLDALAAIVEGPRPVPPRIGWISTFNARCGIATYSAHLLDDLPERVTVFAAHTVDRPLPDTGQIRRCWTEGGQDDLTNLAREIDAEDPEALVIQFNFGFFSIPFLEELVRDQKAAGRTIVFMMHATDDTGLPRMRRLSRLRNTLQMAGRILVHSVHDMNRLKGIGLVENVALFPHGVPHAEVPARPLPDQGGSFTLATYGFMLPQKGFPELIEALGLLRRDGRNVRLSMVNADYPGIDSVRTREAVEAKIAAEGLGDYVSLYSDFLADEDSFALLADADLLVFPYRPTQESASGAIRQAFAVDRPIAATQLPIFDDVAGLINYLPGPTPQDMARGIAAIIDALAEGDPEHPVLRRRARARAWRDEHNYATLAPRLWRQLQAVHLETCHTPSPAAQQPQKV